jgi:hypothetical protein
LKWSQFGDSLLIPILDERTDLFMIPDLPKKLIGSWNWKVAFLSERDKLHSVTPKDSHILIENSPFSAQFVVDEPFQKVSKIDLFLKSK